MSTLKELLKALKLAILPLKHRSYLLLCRTFSRLKTLGNSAKNTLFTALRTPKAIGLFIIWRSRQLVFALVSGIIALRSGVKRVPKAITLRTSVLKNRTKVAFIIALGKLKSARSRSAQAIRREKATPKITPVTTPETITPKITSEPKPEITTQTTKPPRRKTFQPVLALTKGILGIVATLFALPKKLLTSIRTCFVSLKNSITFASLKTAEAIKVICKIIFWPVRMLAKAIRATSNGIIKFTCAIARGIRAVVLGIIHLPKQLAIGFLLLLVLLKNAVKSLILAIFKGIKSAISKAFDFIFFAPARNIKQTCQGILMHITVSTESLKRRFTHISWLSQLIEASRYGNRTSTFMATMFINILSLAFPLALMQVYDRIIPNRSFQTLFFLATGVVTALILELILRVARSYVNLWSDTKYEHALSKAAFSKLTNTPISVYEQTDVGTRSKQFSILDKLKGLYNNQLLPAIFDAPFVPVFLVIVAYIGGWLVLVPILVIVILVYMTVRFSKGWENTLDKKIESESRENDFMIDVLSHIHSAKSMSMEALLTRRYERLQANSIDANYRSSIQTGELATLKMISTQVVIILVAAFGTLSVIHGNMAVGGLAACILLVGRIMQPMSRVLTAFTNWKMVDIVRKQLDAVFQLPSESSAYLPDIGELGGEISLENVNFSLEQKSEKLILKNINITIPPHTFTAITATGGSGKAALLDILALILTPTSGKYLLDGHDAHQYQAGGLRKQIAYLSHSGKLFRGTIMDNLSAFDEDFILTAQRFVKVLGLDTAISKLPNGFDTTVADKVVESLPRGATKLIAVIRALVNKPKIVLFDEENINLDPKSNQKLMEVLSSLKAVATIIVVSKNASTLTLADAVYKLTDGELTRADYGQ